MPTVSFDETMVVATIDYVSGNGYAFAKNGEPESIFCHVNNGVFRIIARGDLLVPDYDCRTKFIPEPGNRLVIIKAPFDPGQKHEKALVWAPESAYQKAVEFRNRTSTTFVAIAVNFRDNGKFVTGRREELFRGTAIQLRQLNASEKSKIVDHYSTTISDGRKRRTFTYDTVWKKVTGGEEVDCDSPLAEICSH